MGFCLKQFKTNYCGKKFFIFICLLVILTIKIGIIMVLIPKISGTFPGAYNISDFADDYHRIAMNLINGNGYCFYPETALTLVRGPGYVMALAGLFSVTGESLLAAQILNIVLSIFTACFIIYLTRKLFKRNALAISAATIFLFHPAIVFSESRAGVESLFAFLVVVFIALLYKAVYSNKIFDYAMAGLTFGFVILVKNTPVLFSLFLLPYLLIRQYRKVSVKSILINFAVMILCMFIIYSPWVIRNYCISGEFAPTTTVKGTTAYQGVYINRNIFSGKEHRTLMQEATQEQGALARDMGLRFKEGFFQYFYSTRDEIMFDKLMFKQAMQEYIKSPLFLIRCCFFNLLGFWFAGRTHMATVLNFILAMPIIILSIIGSYKGYKNNLDISLIIIFILAYMIPHLAILGIARYYVPLIPFLSMLCCLAFFCGGKTQNVSNIGEV